MILVTNEGINGDSQNSANDANNSFHVDQEIEVTITGFKEYGAFCDCGNGYNGLIHISRITPKFVRNVSDYFNIGQKVKARIIEVHDDSKKLSLSTKDSNLEPIRKDGDQSKPGFKELEGNLDSWVKQNVK